jgi:hypothetical protein
MLEGEVPRDSASRCRCNVKIAVQELIGRDGTVKGMTELNVDGKYSVVYQLAVVVSVMC